MKLLVLFLLLINFLFAELIGFNYDHKSDFRILNQLDIEQDFITDLELQQLYDSYISKSKDYYLNSYNESLMIIPTIKEIFKQENIPSSMLFLGMAESNFNFKTVSHMKASGIWQFIPSTAQRYGLQNTQYIDERLDIQKSTMAAAQYLKNLHNIFGKWYLAVIAYNCGEGRLIEGIVRLSLDLYANSNPEFINTKEYQSYITTIKNYQTKKASFSELNRVYNEIKQLNISFSVADLSTIQNGIDRQYIPSESRVHLKKVISFAMMMNKHFDIIDENAHLLNRGVSNLIVPVQAKGGTHLKTLANAINIKYDELKVFNSHLKENYIPLHKKSYQIYIPYSALNLFHQKIDTLPTMQYKKYIVKSGDTLSKIGKLYGINHKSIKEYNNLKSETLKINQELIIPVPNTKDIKIEYIVKKGDTLQSIAQYNKVALNKLVKDNNLKSQNIKEGDKLVIIYE